MRLAAPELLPGRRPLPPGTAEHLAPHGTTIVAVICDGGVVMAGDRRATMGNLIASRDIEKVFPAGPYSLVGYAGAAGVGLELVRLFQVELEHYEKISEDVDDLLDEIDSVLEENAEEFVRGYVQKGGQ